MHQTAAQLQPSVLLSDGQIEFFRREGYLSIPQINTPDEVQRLRVIYDRLFASKAGRSDGNHLDLGSTDADDKEAVLPQILGPAKYAPELAHTLYRANAASIAKQLLGPQAEYSGDHMIFKPALFGAETPWHQDQAYQDPGLEYDTVNVWMPLQDATLENGCMQFVPKSHTWGVLPHHSINHDPRIEGLEVDDAQKYAQTAVACPLSAGGACFFRSYLLHYAGANRSPVPRRAYILVFKNAPRTRKERLHFPWQDKKQTSFRARRKQQSQSAATNS